MDEQARQAPSRPPLRLSQCRNRIEIALLWTITDPLSDVGVTDLQRDTRLLFDVDAAIMNGGIEGLIDNPTGNAVISAREAARRLGLVAAADVLDAVVARFAGGYPPDLDDRHPLVDAFTEEQWDAMDQLGDDWPTDAIHELIESLVDEHPEGFWTTDLDERDEGEQLYLLIDQLVGEALFGDEVADAALRDVDAWASVHGSDDERRRVASELRRLASLRS